jgi:DNA-binding NarL/FixJ family response regulator
VRVVIADDARLFRAGLAALLEDVGCTVTGQAGDADEVLRIVRADPPDAVVLDIRMPPTHTTEGLEAARRLREEHPRLGVLLLSQYLESHWAVALLGGGADHTGYLLKERVADVDELHTALQTVVRGGTVVDPSVVAGLVARRRERDPLDALTERERQVLGLMAEGRSNQAIAQRLFVGDKTVESHVRAIYTKLDLPAGPQDHRRVLAVIALLRG